MMKKVVHVEGIIDNGVLKIAKQNMLPDKANIVGDHFDLTVKNIGIPH